MSFYLNHQLRIRNKTIFFDSSEKETENVDNERNYNETNNNESNSA